MRHREIEKQLSHYLAGEMSEREALRLEEHLEICPECEKKLQEVLDFEESLITIFHTERTPDNLEAEILHTLSEGEIEDIPAIEPRDFEILPRPSQPKFPFLAPTFFLVFLLALLFNIAFFIWPLHKEQRKTSVAEEKNLSQKERGQTPLSERILSSKKPNKKEEDISSPPRVVNRDSSSSRTGKKWKKYRKFVKNALVFGYENEGGHKK